MNKEEEIHFSDETKQLIGRPPNNTIRYGITWIGSFIIIAIILSIVISYNNVISRKVSISTKTPTIKTNTIVLIYVMTAPQLL